MPFVRAWRKTWVGATVRGRAMLVTVIAYCVAYAIVYGPPVAVLLVCLHGLHVLGSPYLRLLRGDFAHARRAFERASRYWLTSRRSRTLYRYNAASMSLLMGQLGDAVARFEQLLEEPKLDPRTARIARAALLTLSVFLGRDAGALVDDVESDLPLEGTNRASLGLTIAHARLTQGQVAAAEAALRAPTPPSARLQRGGGAFFLLPREWQEDCVSTLRGWLFLRLGQADDALPLLRRGAAARTHHVFREQSERLLAGAEPGRSPVDEEPAASLSPQVLG